MESWEKTWNQTRERFFHSLRIAIIILLDASLFALWLAIDTGAEYLVEFFRIKGLHEVPAIIFRLIASGAVLVLAAIPAISDIAEAIGILRRKFKESWKDGDSP